MLYLHGRDSPPIEGGRWGCSTINEGGQVWRATHLYKGTWLIENQYTYICISVKSVSVNAEDT